MPLAGRLSLHRARRPGELAVSIGRASLSYGQLVDRAARVAAGLDGIAPVPGRKLDLPPGGRLVALVVGNDPAVAELFVGATAAPHACAILDPQWAPAQIQRVIARLAPDLLVVGGSLSAPTEHFVKLGFPTVGLGAACAGAEPYEAWLARQAPAEPRRRHHQPGDSDATFLVGFTSGTTASPKPFRRARRSWQVSLAAGRSVFGLDANSHTLAPGPLAHGLALYALAETLDAGAGFYGLPHFNGPAMAHLLTEREIPRIVVVPTMLQALCEAAAAAGAVLGGVRCIVTSGAKLEGSVLTRARKVLPNVEVIEYYGASELGFVTVAKHPGSLAREGVGRPFPGVQVEVRDGGAAGAAAEQGGTIFVRSPLVCQGYLWGEDGHGFRVEDGWATVGDTGRLDGVGALHLAGREGGMLITGGHNVYPAEVESIVKRWPGLDEAVIVGVPDPYLGQALVAVVSGAAAGALTLEDFAKLCLWELPRYKVPRHVLAAREWPLTSSGKIARGEVEGWIRNGDERLVPLPSSR